MGRSSTAQRAHPGKICTECSKCKKSKGKEARNFIHVIDWKEEDKKYLCEEFGLDTTCCLCDACRLLIKRHFKGEETRRSKKRSRESCFLSDYQKCEEQSTVEAETEGWTHLAASLDLQSCTPPDSLPSSIPLCNTHYKKLKCSKQQKCENCHRVIRGIARRCPNPELINKINKDFGLDVEFKDGSPICSDCYHQQRRIVCREENLTSMSVLQDLQDTVKQQEEIAAKTSQRDPPSYAIAQAVVYVGQHLLDNKPLLLKQVYSIYERCWKEAWRTLKVNSPVLVRSKQSVMLELLKVYGHHITYSTKSSQRQHGTLLLRKGSDLRSVVHSLMVQSVDAKLPPVPPQTCSKPPDIPDKSDLANAAQMLNSELRRQSMEFSSKPPTEHNLTSFKVNQHIKEINPVLWNFMYLLTETNTEQRERDRRGDFEWSNHYGTSQSESKRPCNLRRLYQLCHAMYIINDRCSYPLHLLLADTIQCQGGSQALLKILNRFGIVSSRNVLDYHKNTVILSNLHSMEDKITRPSFGFASVDNIDKGAPNAVVTAEGKPRSVHGTSYQLVFPQPHTNQNVGDDFIPCSTSRSQQDAGNSTTKKIRRDCKNLYRCLAARSSASLRSCDRDGEGAPHKEDERVLEDWYAQLYKEEIIDCLASNEEVFMNEVSTFLPISCLDMKARIELLKKQSVTPGVIEAAAVAFLAKCPVYIYRYKEGGNYLFKEFGLCFDGVEPMLLLMDATGFDLIVSNDLLSSSCDLVAPKHNLNMSVFRLWKDRNLFLLSGEQADMSMLTVFQECYMTDDTEPKPAKLPRTKLRVFDIDKEREHRQHQYEKRQRRARPTRHSLEDFKCSPEETQEESLSVKKVLTYMKAKMDRETGSLKEVFTPEQAPEASDVIYLGVLNEHADKIETILNVLAKLESDMKVGKRLKHLIVIGDGKTYCHLQEIKRQYSQEMEWMVPFPGDWHLLKNLQPVLMKIYYHAGLHDLATKNHKAATLTSLAQCHNFKRTHNFLMNAWEALYRIQLHAFVNTNPDEITEEKLRLFSENLAAHNETYRLWHNFVHRDMMSYVLLFLAIRTGNWTLRVLGLKKMAPLFHAYDRPMYLRILPMHLHDIIGMPPSLLNHLKKGGFSVSLSGLEGQSVAGDEAHEMGINRDVKMALHRPDPSLMDMLSLYLPYRAMGQRNLCEQVLPPPTRKQSTGRQQEANVKLYMDALSETVVTQTHPQTTHLHTLLTMQPADEVQTQDMHDFYELGEKDLDSFIMTRILHEPTAQAPRRRRGLRTFLPKQPRRSTVTQKDKNKRIVAACLRRQLAHAKKTGNQILSLDQYIEHPLAIAKSDGSMYKGSKAVATSIYKKRYEGVFDSSLPKEWNTDCVILEGMFLINAVPLSIHKTFIDYAWRIITSFLQYHIERNVSEVHIVFDHPDRNGLSPKTLEKQRRDQQRQVEEGIYTCITADTPLPSNWRKFLADRQQKRLLITYLSTEIPSLVKDILKDNQTLIIAGGLENENIDKAISCTRRGIIHNPVFASNHEEGDSRVWFHACKTTCQSISIYSPDTDTYHIGLPLIINELKEKKVVVQLSMKTADHLYCNMTKFAEKLTNDPDLHYIPAEHRAAILQATYVCSGCDYTSFFAGCGKTAFFAALFQYAEFITSGTVVPGYLCGGDEKSSRLAFFRLIGSVYFKRYLASFRPIKNPHELFKTVECQDEEEKHKMWLDKIREGTWEKADFEDGVMPSNEALSLHWKRCTWVTQLWKQAHQSEAHHPPLKDHGYNVEGSHVSVVWDSDENRKSVASQVDWIMKGCKCSTGCSTKRCKCNKEGRACGPGCGCTNCQNPQNHTHEVAAASDETSMQSHEIELLEQINPDEEIEEVFADVETDAMMWDEDANEEYSFHDDDTNDNDDVN